MNKQNLKPFTKKEDEMVSVLGVVGTALSLTSLFQHFYFTTNGWQVWAMALVYIYSTIAYILTVKKNRFCGVLLIIAAAKLFIIEVLLSLMGVTTPVVMLLFVFTIITIVLLYMENIPAKLKQKFLLESKDEDFWKDKL